MSDHHTPRLNRALEHLAALEVERDGWLRQALAATHVVRDSSTGLSTVTIETPDVSERIGVLIGETVQSLRCALDNLAYSLATSHSGRLSDEAARRSEFPVFGEAAMSAATQRKKIGCIDPAAQELIRLMQPHLTSNYRNDPLWQLHELSRIDKHRVLHAAAVSFQGAVWNSGQTVSQSPRILLQGRIELTCFESDLADIRAENIALEHNYILVFPPGLPRADEPVVDALRELRQHVVTRIVAPLSRFL